MADEDELSPLGAALESLRDDLQQAWRSGQDTGAGVRFRPSPVELTLQVAVTTTGGGSAGIKWWVVNVGGEVSREQAVTHTVKLTLDPVLVDKDGHPTGGELLIDDTDDGDTGSSGGGEQLLDDPE